MKHRFKIAHMMVFTAILAVVSAIVRGFPAGSLFFCICMVPAGVPIWLVSRHQQTRVPENPTRFRRYLLIVYCVSIGIFLVCAALYNGALGD